MGKRKRGCELPEDLGFTAVIDSDDKNVVLPLPTVNMMSTEYYTLPSGRLGHTSRIIAVPVDDHACRTDDLDPLPSQHIDTLVDHIPPTLDDDGDTGIDPAYLEHIEEVTVGARQKWPTVWVFHCQFPQFITFMTGQPVKILDSG